MRACGAFSKSRRVSSRLDDILEDGYDGESLREEVGGTAREYRGLEGEEGREKENMSVSGLEGGGHGHWEDFDDPRVVGTAGEGSELDEGNAGADRNTRQPLYLAKQPVTVLLKAHPLFGTLPLSTQTTSRNPPGPL